MQAYQERIIITQISIVITVVVNITINSYGEECLDHITHSDKLEWAADPSSGVVKYMEKKHFDPAVPQNHNVKIANVKNRELSVYQNGVWKRTPATPFLTTEVVNLVSDLFNAADVFNMSDDVSKFYDDIDNKEDKALKDSINALLCLIDNKKKLRCIT